MSLDFLKIIYYNDKIDLQYINFTVIIQILVKINMDIVKKTILLDL